MDNDAIESLIMQLIMNSGNARSLGLEAVQCAKNNLMQKAYEKIAEAEEFLACAHDIQTQLLFKEAQGDDFKLSLLLTHSQDHLMNAISINDLAKQMIEIWEFSHKIRR